MKYPSRRMFLKQSAAAGAVVALAGCRDDGGSDGDPGPLLDVAIIGGGLSGLSAARQLVASGVDKVAVIEARDRVGGRTLSQPIADGEFVDGGAQWIGPTQTEVAALAAELGIETFPTYIAGERIFYLSGFRLRESELNPSPQEQEDLDQAIAKLDQLASTIPVEEPWNAPNAAALDAMSVSQWLDDNVTTEGARFELEASISTTLSSAASQLSLLYFAFYIASAGSYHLLEDIEGGAQETRLVDGAQQLSLRMVELLGDRVKLSLPIDRIEQKDERVLIKSGGTLMQARRVIVAMMPADVHRIEISPPLPDLRRELNREWPDTGSGFKVHAVYDRPFWRDEGLNGQGLSDGGLVEATFDNSPRDGSPGVLLAFIQGDNAPRGEAARKRAVLDGLADLFGDEAKNAIDYVEQSWSDERFTAGCVSPLAPGQLTRFGSALRPPSGLIHWAGTETSTVWTGYMEGAIRAGKRAAREVIDALG